MSRNKCSQREWLADNLHKTNGLGQMPLHSAAQNGKLDVVQWLVEKGADVSASDKYGWTVLHFAAHNKKLDVVQWLVEKGADVSASDKEGNIAVDVAEMQGDDEMVKWLQSYLGRSHQL